MGKSWVVVVLVAIAAWYSWPLLKQYITEEEGRTTSGSPTFDNFMFDQTTQTFRFTKAGGEVLRGKVGQRSELGQGSDPCMLQSDESGVCVEFKTGLKLEVREKKFNEAVCYDVNWQATRQDVIPTDCYDLADAHWYGGSEMYHQRWPIEKLDVAMQPYLSSDILLDIQGKFRETYGSVIERFWVNSRGVGIVVPYTVPLHVSVNHGNDGQLCFKADYNTPKYKIDENALAFLKYRICVGENVKAIHRFLSNLYFDKPNGIPDKRMFRSPVWSTWARYKMAVNQSIVVNFAREIKKFGFSNSQIEIDDIWSPTYGDIVFDKKKFPHPGLMVATLQKLGYRVTAWVTPFANPDSEAFAEGKRKGYWVKNETGGAPAMVKWWQGTGALIDVTNPEAVDWYVSRLNNLRREVKLDSYKFDAGEIVYFPSSHKTHTPLEHPGQYTEYYVKTVSRLGDLIEVRVGHQTQREGIFVRMFDKDSKWGYDNGLKTMIPTALLMGILGYPFILPDMIGGNAYGETSFHVVDMPERELFIRWMQLSAYMPSMQFSISPWQYDKEVALMGLQMVKVHQEIVTPLILKLAEESVKSGAPILRPLWWVAPNDEAALTIDSEFLIGDDFLVAPILDKGARKRDIYLPRGQWKDELGNLGNVNGGQWLYDYKIDLDQIATFTRISQR
ncbi:myogenesis-regulating glycosidase-like [Glandiceps talaboti]